MRHLLAMSLVLVGCAGKGGSTSTTEKTPIVPATPAAPAVTIQWPPTGAIETSSFGSYSCSTIEIAAPEYGVECFDGTSTMTQPSPYQNEVISVVVGDGIACALLDGSGTPSTCTTNLTSDPSCSNGPTTAAVVCWTPTATTPVLMNIQNQRGYSDQTLYNSGPSALTVDGSGTVCITQSIYDENSVPYGNWIADVTQCGTTIGAGGYLQ
jgi:hypothetical protein